MSELPSEWKVLPLGEIAEVVGGGTPSRDNPAFWGNDHYWITPSEVVAIDGKTAGLSKERISDLGLASSGAKLHPPGTILMTSRASIGFAAIAEKEICTNQGFQSLRCGEELDKWFALHQIRHRRAELQQLAAGSTFLEISGSNVRSFPFVVPPLPEQKKIAEILSGIDNMLHLTLQQLSRITKLRQRISRSYFEGDQFRQHQSHEFTMGELAHGRHGIVDGPFGSNLKTEHYKESGIPVIQSGFVTSGKFVAENYKYVDRAKYEEQIRSSVSGGDLVMAKIGANAGRSALIPSGHPSGILAGNCLKITPNENLITKEYLAELMNYYYFSGRLADITNTTAQPAVSMSQLKKLSVFMPAIADQKKICSSLHSLDAVVSQWEDKHLKISLIKKALCSDLLSGRKRVSI